MRYKGQLLRNSFPPSNELAPTLFPEGVFLVRLETSWVRPRSKQGTSVKMIVPYTWCQAVNDLVPIVTKNTASAWLWPQKTSFFYFFTISATFEHSVSQPLHIWTSRLGLAFSCYGVYLMQHSQGSFEISLLAKNVKKWFCFVFSALED
jgi:hypothetical protein